eukprot:scaffold266637_cov17-Tisochrysis_lutea.AAC.1
MFYSRFADAAGLPPCRAWAAWFHSTALFPAKGGNQGQGNLVTCLWWMTIDIKKGIHSHFTLAWQPDLGNLLSLCSVTFTTQSGNPFQATPFKQPQMHIFCCAVCAGHRVGKFFDWPTKQWCHPCAR